MKFSPKVILLPLALGPEDEIEMAREAIQAACSMAQAFKAKIVMLNVSSLENPGTDVSSNISGEMYRTLALIHDDSLKRSKAALLVFEKEITAQGLSCESRIVESLDKSSTVICEVAEDVGADLIVINSHARRGIKRLLLGSVAEKVAHNAQAAVLLLHH